MNMIVIVCLIAGLLLFAGLMASRSQGLQRFAVMELVLLLAVAGGAVWSYQKAERFGADQYLRFFGVYLQQMHPYMNELEETEEIPIETERQKAEALLSSILPVTTESGKEYTYLNAALLSRKGGTYESLLSFGEDSDFLTETEQLAAADRLADRAVTSGNVVYETMPGSRSGLLAVTASGKIAPAKVMVVEVPILLLQMELEALKQDYFYGGLAVLLIGTMLIAGVIFIQGAELRSMVKVMIRVGQGQEEWEEAAMNGTHPHTWSREMRSLWNSLGQIVMGVARVNYEKYRMLQAYYRFAPKEIEHILNKKSILEVQPNDSMRTSGVLGILSLAGNRKRSEKEYIERMNENYGILLHAQKEQGGIFLSGNGDLSLLRMMFQEKTKKALHFGIEAASACEEAGMEQEDRIFLLLHKTSFLYAVAGDEEQASSYLLSDEIKSLEKYTDRMRSMGIRMAVTDTVYEVVKEEAACRYIGFLEEGSSGFKLYEVLDAYPTRERAVRLELDWKFQEGLQLFYQDDFYLARKQFAEVLRECPSDEVAKWYLFTCEKWLNHTGSGRISYGFLQDGLRE